MSGIQEFYEIVDALHLILEMFELNSLTECNSLGGNIRTNWSRFVLRYEITANFEGELNLFTIPVHFIFEFISIRRRRIFKRKYIERGFLFQ